MLVNFRLQARVLYEKARCLTSRLKATEHTALKRERQVLARDKNIERMQETIQDLERKVKLENVRTNFSLTQIKQATEKEKIELKNAMEKVTVEYENEKEVFKRVIKEEQQQIAIVQNRLQESIRETAIATKNFKTIYNEYHNLEQKFRVIETDLFALKRFIYELAEVMNLNPVELLIKLEKLKVAIASTKINGNLGELFAKALLDAEKDEVYSKNSQVGCTSRGRTSSTSINHNEDQPGSFEGPSCPLSQKVLGEQVDEPLQQELQKKRGKVVRIRLAGLKISSWLPMKKCTYR